MQLDFSNKILSNAWENYVLSRITRISLSGNANAIKINGIDETSRADGSRSGGVLSYWLPEAAEKTASKPKFRQISFETNKLTVLCYATDELIQDAGALGAAITKAFQDELNFKLTDAVINGSGAGQPLGIMASGCLVSVSAEAGQAASTVVYENVVKMNSRLLPGSHANAVWLINPDIEPQLHSMSLAVGTGGVPVYMPAGRLSGKRYNTLFGKPVLHVSNVKPWVQPATSSLPI